MSKYEYQIQVTKCTYKKSFMNVQEVREAYKDVSGAHCSLKGDRHDGIYRILWNGGIWL